MKFTEAQKQEAREAVANWWIENAKAILAENAYASHVTESEKLANYRKGLAFAESIRSGSEDGCFTIAQRIHEHLTGECPALLP